MKKRCCLIIMLFCLGVTSTIAQKLVFDIGLAEVMGSLLGAKGDAVANQLKMSEKMMAMQLAKKMENAAEFMQTLKAIEKLVQITGNLVCQIDGLEIALKNSHLRYDNCGFKLDFKIIDMDYQSIRDALEIIVDKDFSKDGLSAADRVKSLGKTAAKIDALSIKIENIVDVINTQNVIYLNRQARKLEIENSNELVYSRY